MNISPVSAATADHITDFKNTKDIARRAAMVEARNAGYREMWKGARNAGYSFLGFKLPALSGWLHKFVENHYVNAFKSVADSLGNVLTNYNASVMTATSQGIVGQLKYALSNVPFIRQAVLNMEALPANHIRDICDSAVPALDASKIKIPEFLQSLGKPVVQKYIGYFGNGLGAFAAFRSLRAFHNAIFINTGAKVSNLVLKPLAKLFGK